MDVSVTSYSPYNLQTTTSKQIRGSTSASSENSSLSAEESRQLQQLKARDREVRAHEAAHVAAGGNLVRGGASFTYQQGPDGQQYAIGGEVSIDTSKVANDPEATLQKANQIRAAALAPSSPSSQDRSVAAKASQLAIEARAEIAQQRNQQEDNNNSETVDNNQRSGSLFDVIV